jgi:putative heme-binding domain-containing protein
MSRNLFLLFAGLIAVVAYATVVCAEEPALFKRDNLVAWCIVPFDSKNRGPAERAAMVKKLGFTKVAYDWRANHVPTFEEEIVQYKKHGLEYFAFWSVHDKAFELFAKYDLHPQIWQMLAAPNAATQEERVAAAVKQILPLVERTAKMKCKLGLYNHGGWGGEPDNMIAVCKVLRDKHKADHVGIVYNLHHGHEHIKDFAQALAAMKPFLLCLNLNGMNDKEPQILPLGAGQHDVSLLKIIRDSAYKGPIGIIGHTNDDVEERLRDNLDGLDWILPQPEGKKAGPKPTPRTLSKLKNPAKPAGIGAPVSLPIPDGANLAVMDPKLKVTLIDRSPDEAYMAVKPDGTGRIFVGGREKVFVFEPIASGFKRVELLRLPPDSIVIGVEFRGDDLYVLASQGLYLVPHGRTQTTGLAPKRILWGLPLDHHLGFHCLTWGPEGDLYLNHGDPLLNFGDWQRPDHHGHWTLFAGPKGEKVSFTGAGAVLKVRPDGANPRVVAGGLRGPVGLAFDRQWNLFTNENDHESMADRFAPCKLLHVTPHADFGWPRGWMARKSPERSDLLDCIHGALGRGVPCDLAGYDEPAIAAIRGNLLMCRWDRFEVTRYLLKPNGATFTAEEFTFAKGSNNLRPTGIGVDRIGRIFVTGLYLASNVVTPKCPSDLVMISLAEDAKPITVEDETKADAPALWKMLSSDSWDVRHRAHTELLRRGGQALAGAVRRLKDVKDNEVLAAHLPWLAAAAGGEEAMGQLEELAGDAKRPVLRLQALRALSAFPQLNPPIERFCVALIDEDPKLQLAGLGWFLDSESAFLVKTVAGLAGGRELVVRQAAATLLAQRNLVNLEAKSPANDFNLAQLLQSKAAEHRLAAVLAIGMRLTMPPSNARAPEGIKLAFPKDSAWFTSKLEFADSREPVVITALGPVGSYSTAQKWAAGKPTAAEERLFQLLMRALGDTDDAVRNQAAYYLGLLRDPRSEPVIARVQFEYKTRGLVNLPPRAVPKLWRIGPFFNATPVGESAIERGAIDLSIAQANGGIDSRWLEAGAENGRFTSLGKGVSYGLFRIQSRDRQPALLTVSDGGPVHVWSNGRRVPVEPNYLCLLDLQPGGNDVLVRSAGAGALELSVRAARPTSIELPEKTDGKLLAERLKGAKGAPIPAEFLTIDWASEGRKGDAAAGRKLFGALGCVKCHAVTSDQAGGGAPSLADAGKRFTAAHVAESILIPDRVIAEEFRTTALTLADGRTISGLLVRETADELEMLLPDTNRIVVKAVNVEERRRTAVSPMPSGLVKTPGELRDLITYLLADRVVPP